MDRILSATRACALTLAAFISSCSTPAAEPTPPATTIPLIDPCPRSEFLVTFTPATTDLDDSANEIFDAATQRTRMCYDKVMIVSLGYAEQFDLAQRRAEVAYEALAQRLSQRGIEVRRSAVLGCTTSAEDQAALTILPLGPTRSLPC